MRMVRSAFVIVYGALLANCASANVIRGIGQGGVSGAETTRADAASGLLAHAPMASLVKGSRFRHANTGRPSSVVATATTNGVLFSDLRPR